MKKIITTALIMLLITTSSLSQTAKGYAMTVKSGNWSDPTVWSTNLVPDSTIDVIILNGYSVTINNPNVSAFGITIDTTCALTAFAGGDINVYGDWNMGGQFNSNVSTVIFKGKGNKYVLDKYTALTFENLSINGPDSVFFYSNVKIMGELNLIKGVMDMTTSTLTLLSDSNKTSRIAPISPNADLLGKITVQRYMHNTTPGWKFYGSAVNGATIGDIKDDVTTYGYPTATVPSYSFCSVNHYDELVSGPSVQGYVNVSSCSDPMLSKDGYRVWIDSGSYIMDVTGTALKFNQNFNVSYTSDNTAPAEDGWCLIANPYASSIDWNSTAWTKTNMDDAVYVWNPVNQQYATYINGVSTNGGSNIIPSSQSFFVRANQNSPSLSCNENVKSSNNGTFMRTVNPNDNTNSIKLILSNASYSDETVINFSPNATRKFDGKEDGLKLMTLNPKAPNIHTVEYLTNLSVNTLPSDLTNLDIPVCVKVGVSGTYTIQSNINMLIKMYSSIVLEDTYAKTKTDFNNGATYVFTINDTTTAPRFILHLSSPVKSVMQSENQSSEKVVSQISNGGIENKVKFTVFPNPNSGEFTIDISGLENNHEITLYLRDEKGVIVYNSYFNTQDESSIQRKINPDAKLNNGIYFCTVVIQGIEQTLKVIVN